MKNYRYLLPILLLIFQPTTKLCGQQFELVVDTFATAALKYNNSVFLFADDGTYKYDLDSLQNCGFLWILDEKMGQIDDTLYNGKLINKGVIPRGSTGWKNKIHMFSLNTYYGAKTRHFERNDSTFLYFLESGNYIFLGKHVNVEGINNRYVVYEQDPGDKPMIYDILKDTSIAIPKVANTFPLTSARNEHFIWQYYKDPSSDQGADFVYTMFDLNMNPIETFTINAYRVILLETEIHKDFLCYHLSSAPPRAYYKNKTIQLPSEITEVRVEDNLNYCIIKTKDNKYGIMDFQGNYLIKPIFSKYKIKQHHDIKKYPYTMLTDNNTAILIDENANTIVKGNYDLIRALDENRYIVELNGQSGVINKLGKEIISIKNHNDMYFRLHNLYGEKFISLKKGYGTPGSNFILFDYDGNEFAEWTVSTEQPRVNHTESEFRLTIKFLSSLTSEQIHKISKSNAWDVSNRVDGKLEECLVDNLGNKLICRFESFIPMKDPYHWIVMTKSKKYGILKLIEK